MAVPSFELLHQSQRPERDPLNRPEWHETELFPAVRTYDIPQIVHCVERLGIDVNAVDIDGQNAMQAALVCGKLSVKVCRTLIQLGINLDHSCDVGRTALAEVVCYYKEYNRPEKDLALFRCMVENGANIHVNYKEHGEIVSVRERIRTHPDMEAIVEMLPALHVQRARRVFQVIKGDPGITRLICQMIGYDPGPFWKPPVCADPKPRKYGTPVPCHRITPPL